MSILMNSTCKCKEISDTYNLHAAKECKKYDDDVGQIKSPPISIILQSLRLANQIITQNFLFHFT